ncbi:hypothetical protein EFQ99_13575 [Rhizobium vallis]|uniref:WYL domain-containing protein n=1 Tax=Rhizobium vallis TaxID=634290 RepID=A0A3S0SQ78_9HYPH|nr:hypothetical protein [Rhizobium vallis]RUM24709.1 hypothetical protein EFQ99_13575 [Rhizobium vallis]
MMLGLSLSLTNTALLNHGVHRPAPPVLITQAIQNRCRITCKINGKASVLEPYALYKALDETFLNAVVVYSEKKSLRKFQITKFAVAALSEMVVTNDNFFANWAFDVSSINPEKIIAAIELVAYS